MLTFVAHVAPGLGRQNGRLESDGRGGRRNAARYDEFKDTVAIACNNARRRAGVGTIREGVVGVSLTFYWPTRTHRVRLAPQPWPNGDVDAAIKATLDALADGGAYDTDARVGEVHARKRYDKDAPRVVVHVFAVDP